MTVRRFSRASSVVLAVSILAGFAGCRSGATREEASAAPPAEQVDPRTSAHASLAAYPGAVLACRDPATGATFEVASDGRTLVARDGSGKETLRVDVIARCGVPAVGEPLVRHLVISGPTVRVTFGKHSYASIDLKDPTTLTCSGSE